MPYDRPPACRRRLIFKPRAPTVKPHLIPNKFRMAPPPMPPTDPWTDFPDILLDDVPRVLHRMREVEDFQRPAYLERLVELGPAVLPHLVALLRDPDVEIRVAAVHNVGELIERHELDAEPLDPFVTDQDASVRWTAALHLVKQNRQTDLAVPILLEDFKVFPTVNFDEDNEYDYDEECGRIEVLEAIGSVDPAPAAVIEAAIDALDDACLTVRHAALRCLTRLGTAASDAIPKIRTLLDLAASDSRHVSNRSTRASDWHAAHQQVLLAVAALHAIGGECRDGLVLEVLRHPQAGSVNHYRAIQILGDLPITDAVRDVASDYVATLHDPFLNQAAESNLDRGISASTRDTPTS